MKKKIKKKKKNATTKKLLLVMQSFANYLNRASPVSDPAKTFLTSKFSSLLFSNPTRKTAAANNRWETTNSKLHGPIIMLDQLENSRSCCSPIIERGLFFFQFCDVATVLAIIIHKRN